MVSAKNHVDGGKQRQQRLTTGFAKKLPLRSRPGMIDAIAIQELVLLTKP